jgi:hypothetical protein
MPKPASLALGPQIPATYDPHHVAGLQAMQRGEASPHQQQQVLKWLIENAAGTYQFHYYPSERDTAFALGRAFPGQQIVKLLNLDLSILRRNANADPSIQSPG